MRYQLGRHLGRAGGNQYRPIGGFSRPAQGFPGKVDFNIAISQAFQYLSGFLRQLGQALHANHITGQFGENRRLVAAARSDFQHLFRAGQLQRLGHQGDNEGLRNGLVQPDGQRDIFVGEVATFLRHESLPGYAGHSLKDSPVLYFSAKVLH